MTHSIVLPRGAQRGGLGINVRATRTSPPRVVRVKRGTPASVLLCATQRRRRTMIPCGSGSEEEDGSSDSGADDDGCRFGDGREESFALDGANDCIDLVLRRIAVGDILAGANGCSLLDVHSAKELSQRIAAAASQPVAGVAGDDGADGSGDGDAASRTIRLDFCASPRGSESPSPAAAALTFPATGAGERHAVLFRIASAVAAAARASAAAAAADGADGGADDDAPLHQRKDAWADAIARSINELAVSDATVRLWRRAFVSELALTTDDSRRQSDRERRLCAPKSRERGQSQRRPQRRR